MDRRVARLERRYASAAQKAANLARELPYKSGQNSQLDPCRIAKRHYLLGLLVQKRDQLEARYHAWQATAEKLQKWLTALREWKGRKLPYTLGAVDVSCLLWLIDELGVGRYANFRYLAEQVTSLLAR
jgi:hypothetical protein